VALCYDPPQSVALRQGEILQGIWEHIPRFPAVESQPGQSFVVDSVAPELVVVMNSDCDLEWDFKARFPDQSSREQLSYSGTLDPLTLSGMLSYVFLVEMHKKEHMRPLVRGSDLWRRVEQNQDERYHRFNEALVGKPATDSLPDLYLDFKKSLALPIAGVYEGIRVGGVMRIALIPDKYIHDLIHRYYGFLSRVAVPE
jgi:hypothetical protein